MTAMSGLLLCVTLLVAPASAAPYPEAKIVEMNTPDFNFTSMLFGGHEGFLNGGIWRCPWTFHFEGCSEGTFTCPCPGDQKLVTIRIPCCYSFPRCGVICHTSVTCNRFQNCETCRSDIPEATAVTCLSCRPGFSLGSGNCSQDIDECRLNNGDCDHNCHNTYSSYYCTCRKGYALLKDGQTCQQRRCERPVDIPGLAVETSDDGLYGTYAHYRCLDAAHALMGPKRIRCAGNMDHVWWDGHAPRCIDPCAYVSRADRMVCGRGGVSQATCWQLGCCYDQTEKECFQKPAVPFVSHPGEAPVSAAVVRTHEDHHTDACAHLCGTSRDCESFSIRQVPDGSDGAQVTCHLLEKSRRKLVQENQIKHDNHSTLYQTVLPNDKPSTYNSFEGENVQVKKLLLGCFADDENDRDLPSHVIAGDDHMTVVKCIDTCRQQGYGYAGLQGGTECFCGNNMIRKYEPAEDCEVKCTGNQALECGGQSSNSIYKVNPEECIDACMTGKFKYAAIQNGGSCYCGNSYERVGEAEEIECHLKCPGYGGRQTCGGDGVSSIYLTERAYDMSEHIDRSAVKIFDSKGSVRGFSVSMYTFFPGLRSIVTDSLILYSSEPVRTPTEAASISTVDSYAACGEIANTPPALHGNDVTLRFLYLRLSHLHKHVGAHAKVVRVYAQTVVIDASIIVNYALLVRARQIVVDLQKWSFQIDVVGDVPAIGHDERDVNNGPDTDVKFAKYSYTCARILVDTHDQTNINTAWGIMREISNVKSDDNEIISFSGVVKTYMAQVGGMERLNVHIVPMYTKDHLAKLLTTYYDRISVYKRDLERLEDRTISDDEFLRYAEDMNMMYVTTAVIEASYAYDQAMQDVRRHTDLYGRMYTSYKDARVALEESEEVFRSGIKEMKVIMIAQSVVKFVKGVALVAVGAYTEQPSMVVDGIQSVFEGIKNLDNTMDQLAKLVYEVEQFTERIDFIQQQLGDTSQPFDPTDHIHDVEMVITLQEQIVHWQNIKSFSLIILSHQDIMKVRGAGEYNNALMGLCNWGEALSKSMVERAEAMRDTMFKRAFLDSKLDQQKHTEAALEAMRSDISHRPALLAAMHEQTDELRLDLNEGLLTFCQAYFFENLVECRDSYKPSFGDSLSQLLLKISAASRDSLLVNKVPSTVARIITIEDSDTSSNCNDVKLCPINYLRHHRSLIYEIPVDHPDLIDLEQYRVSEIALDAVGAAPSEDNAYLQFMIDASGDFHGRAGGEVYSFLTRPLAKAYEYCIDTGHVSVYADVYQPLRGVISHITPYTTWVLRVYEERSSDIDLSNVTELRMTLHGSSTISKDQYTDKPLSYLDSLLSYYFGYQVTMGSSR